jgi:predicted lipid-binding transport protein (Tim44 family)
MSISFEKERTMQRSVTLTALSAMFLAMVLWSVDAWARAGGGGSSGSRGSRSFSAPARPDSGAATSGRQAVPPSGFQQSSPQRSGWMGGLMGGIGGFMLGGLLGSMLFGGMGGGLFGGIGLMEIVLIGGLLYLGYVLLRRRQQQPAPATSYGYSAPMESNTGSWQSGPMAAPSATMDMPDAAGDLQRGLGYISQMDAGFDPRRFQDTASDLFFRVQGAWMGRDLTPVRDLLAPEIYETMQKDTERLRAEHHIDRMENIALRSAEISEAWQESGRDYITVHFLASMLDYTVDERTNEVVKGSRSEPVKFEEYWTFVRPVGPNPWRLSAIQQA